MMYCDAMIFAAAQAIFWPTWVFGVRFECLFMLTQTGENSICPGFNLRVPPRVGANRRVCITTLCLRC